jgi:DNA-binding transcriptional regulator GbsR (MarR family)
MTSVQEIREEFIHIYEGVAERRGLQPVFGRVMAAFFLEGRGLTQRELSELTGYSLSSVSRTLESMNRMGLVTRHKSVALGSYVYHMKIDFTRLTLAGLKSWIEQAEETRQNIRELKEKAEDIESLEEREEASQLVDMLSAYETELGHVLRVIESALAELAREETS